MKLIIAGSRHLDFEITYKAIGALFLKNSEALSGVIEIVSGTAKGVDKTGEYFAECNYLPVKQFPADWNTHGKSAGHIRNKQMAEYADALLLIWDGKSKGSANMKMNMSKLNKPIYEVVVDGD